MLLRFCLVVALSATALNAADQTPPSDLPAPEIIRRASLRDDQLRRDRQRFECDVKLTVEALDAAGMVLSSRAKSFVLRPTADLALGGELIGSDGKAGDKDAVEAKKFMAVMDLQKLAPRYEMTREESATELGRACHVIRYRPRRGQPYDTREEKVMNQLTGRFWIAKDDFTILRSEGRLERPVTVALVASVYRLDFSYRAMALPSGEPVPESFELVVSVKAPLYHSSQRQRSVMAGYRKKG